jgi:hypothetical protein
MHIWSKYGEREAEAAFRRTFPLQNWPPGKAPPEFRFVIRGQIEYLGFVRNYDFLYQRIAQTLSGCDPTFAPKLPKVPQSGRVIFAGEGPSDVQHVQAAVRALGREFAGLELTEVSHQPPRGEARLWTWLQSKKDSHNIQPVVGVFDADSEFEGKIGPKGWVHLGNGVVAMAIARPDWISQNNRCCIELLHHPETLLRTDAEDRRVFLRSEFDGGGQTADKQFQMRHPQKTTLVVEEVQRNSDGKSVGLAKVRFAENLAGQVAPYGVVRFDGFRPTLRRLWEAVAAAQTSCS